MSKLALHLPPFAPDYSGVCSALFELGGLVVINDASGCTGNYTGYDEPRWYGSTSLVFCSNLRELDVVMGDDERLVNKIARAAQDTNPNFIAVLGSPVPMLVGADLAGIAAEVQAATGIPSLGFNTTGLAYYNKGISDALLAFAQAFVAENREPDPNSNAACTARATAQVNLLGATPLDFGVSNVVESLTQLLQEAGLTVGACFAMGSSFANLCNAGGADVNLVLTTSGLALAKYLQNRFGTPYVVGLPIGDLESQRIIAELKAACLQGANTATSAYPVERATQSNAVPTGSEKRQNTPQSHSCDSARLETSPVSTCEINSASETPKIQHQQNTTPAAPAKRVLIIHEQIIANSLRNCLAADYGLADIRVISPFALCPEYAQDQDSCIDSEQQLAEAINGDYSLVVADPLFAQMLEAKRSNQPNHSTQFIPLPHLAISSKLHWDNSVDFIGKGAFAHFSPYI